MGTTVNEYICPGWPQLETTVRRRAEATKPEAYLGSNNLTLMNSCFIICNRFRQIFVGNL